MSEEGKLSLSNAELGRRGTIEEAGEREGLKLPAVTENRPDGLAVEGELSEEMDVGEVAEGKGVGGEYPCLVLQGERS